MFKPKKPLRQPDKGNTAGGKLEDFNNADLLKIKPIKQVKKTTKKGGEK